MKTLQHPLRWGTFLVILFGIIGFLGSYAATFVWTLLKGNPWQNYLGWVSLAVILFLAFIIWATSGLIGLVIGGYKFRK